VSRAAPMALVVVAVLVVAVNFRGPIVAVSAVVDAVRADLGIDAATAGLFTSLPVLCFAVATPLASALLARAGLAGGVLAALGLLLVGTLVRSAGVLPAAVAGTLLIGVAITVGNIAIPVVIGRELPRHSAAMLGAYTATMNVGSMITLSFTAPIAAVAGWQIALASWGGLTVVAALVWRRATRRFRGEAPPVAAEAAGPAGGAWWRRPPLWGLMIGFGAQAFSYYGMTAWLPMLLRDELGMDPAAAGVSSSIFQVAAVVGALGVPVLLRGSAGPRPVVLLVAAAWIALPVGMLLAPHAWAVWCGLAGAAQGGGFTVIFAAAARLARDTTDNRRISALVQGGGYLVAATAPAVLGAVHEATAGWTGPLLIVLATVTVFGVATTAAAGNRGRTSPRR
jgi:MFS transporter, CP family, cyanate transporter